MHILAMRKTKTTVVKTTTVGSNIIESSLFLQRSLEQIT